LSEGSHEADRKREAKLLSQHSLAVASRHSSGRRLMDVCDYVLDTRVPAGDAILTLPGLPYPIGPASTFASVTLIQAVMAEAVQWMVSNGFEPPVRIRVRGGELSASFERQGDEFSEIYLGGGARFIAEGVLHLEAWQW
jgi:uncharacterized phosphosugar-binding protein